MTATVAGQHRLGRQSACRPTARPDAAPDCTGHVATDPGSSVVTDGGDGWVSSMAERGMHRRMQRRTESWGATVEVDKPPDSPAEREPGRMHAAAQ